jgi:hypothetical protein
MSPNTARQLAVLYQQLNPATLRALYAALTALHDVRELPKTARARQGTEESTVTDF